MSTSSASAAAGADAAPAGPETEAARADEIDPLTQVGESFKAAMGAVRRLRGREARHPDKLSYAQYSLLFGLADEPQLSASRLAYVADLAPATVTEMLDHLETDGLVQRTRSDRDKRVVLVSLTRRGKTLVQRRRAHLERRWREELADFDDEQLRNASAVLDRLAELFDEFAAE
jgi:DNA-binding MarR family transcriptional regulator